MWEIADPRQYYYVNIILKNDPSSKNLKFLKLVMRINKFLKLNEGVTELEVKA